MDFLVLRPVSGVPEAAPVTTATPGRSKEVTEAMSFTAVEFDFNQRDRDDF